MARYANLLVRLPARAAARYCFATGLPSLRPRLLTALSREQTDCLHLIGRLPASVYKDCT